MDEKSFSRYYTARRNNDQIIITTDVYLLSAGSSFELSRGGDAVHNVTATCQGEPPRRNYKICSVTVVGYQRYRSQIDSGLRYNNRVLTYVRQWRMQAVGKTYGIRYARGRDKNMIGGQLMI